MATSRGDVSSYGDSDGNVVTCSFQHALGLPLSGLFLSLEGQVKIFFFFLKCFVFNHSFLSNITIWTFVHLFLISDLFLLYLHRTHISFWFLFSQIKKTIWFLFSFWSVRLPLLLRVRNHVVSFWCWCKDWSFSQTRHSRTVTLMKCLWSKC